MGAFLFALRGTTPAFGRFRAPTPPNIISNHISPIDTKEQNHL